MGFRQGPRVSFGCWRRLTAGPTVRAFGVRLAVDTWSELEAVLKRAGRWPCG